MQRRGFLGWLAGLFGAGAATAVTDVTNFTSGGWAENVAGEAPAETTRVQPSSVALKVGDLEVDSPTGKGKFTTLKIGGKPVAAKSVVLSVDTRGLWVADITYFPALGLYGKRESE